MAPLVASSQTPNPVYIDTVGVRVDYVCARWVHGICVGKKLDTLYTYHPKAGFNIAVTPEGRLLYKKELTLASNGKLINNGLYHTFSKRGKTELRGNYENNQPVGVWEIHTSKSSTSRYDYFQLDFSTLQATYFYPSGQLESYGKLDPRRAKEYGTFSSFKPRTGLWYFYYLNGQIKCRGELAWYGRIGEWHFYNKDGKIETVRSYKKQYSRYKSINVSTDYRDVCDCDSNPYKLDLKN